MKSDNKIQRFFIGVGVVVLQLIATQIVTFIASMFIPNAETFPATHSLVFCIIVGVTFTVGVYLTGWLALKLQFLKSEPRYVLRLVSALAGAYLPLIVALLFFAPLESGHPSFGISMLACILGFHLPGWLGRR